MPEVTGLQLAHSLKNPPSIILTTAHRDFAPEAFELDVVDYLLKPISFERLLKAVNKFFDRISINGNLAPDEASERSDFVFLRAERKIHKLPINEILYFESLDDFVKVHLKAKTLITRENISTLEGTLPKTVFVRIHRSFIVNSRFVATLSNDGVGIGGRELPFGRVFKRAALSRLSTSDK
jgi:DNA-binding LytR/AlgR family response regulator